MITPVAESTFVSRLVCVLLSFVGGRLCGACCGPPTAFPVGHRCTVGVLAGTHRCGKAPTLLCVVVGVVGVVTSCARVPRVSRDVITSGCSSCATEITYTPARLEALFELSVVAILRHLHRSLHHFCGLLGALSNSSSCSRSHRHVLACCLHLVHVNAKLFLSRWIDQWYCHELHWAQSRCCTAFSLALLDTHKFYV